MLVIAFVASASISDAAFSTKNGPIIFGSTPPSAPGAVAPNAEIWSMNANGSDQRALTPNPDYSALRSSVSPDGRRIVFVSNHSTSGSTFGENFDLVAMNMDGTQLQQLTHTRAFEGCPAYSPDGHKIYYASSFFHTNGIWEMNTDGSHRHRITHQEGCPSFSRSGPRIVFIISNHSTSGSTFGENFDLVAMNMDGTQLQQLTHTRAFEGCPAYSPDGHKIYYASSFFHTNGIWEMNTDGSHRHRITHQEGCPSFSRSGPRIVFIKLVRLSNGHVGSEITVMNVNGTHRHVVLRTHQNDFDASFSPNGRQIVFTGNSPKQDIYVINANGTHLHRLTHQPRLNECASFSPDGRKIAYVHKTRSWPRLSHIWVMNANGSHPRQLTSAQRQDSCPIWAPQSR